VTRAATRFDGRGLEYLDGVATRAELAALSVSADHVASQVRARRWRVLGSAVVLHNGSLTVGQRQRVALINCGPRAVLTSFTAARRWGLQGWSRPEIHVLAPAGTRRPDISGLVLHRARQWRTIDVSPARRLHRLAPALVVAASSFGSPRPGCGLLAAAVQQRLVSSAELRSAVTAATRRRHRSALLLALDDIAQGAQALSEIDFVRLCRRHALPGPRLQAVRTDPAGRRRYLDAEWDLADGRVLAVEVDGALHLSPRRWYDDQLRQNEVVLGGSVVLRYPSVIVRTEEATVVAQLRRALSPRR
jgi:hypothetical protein